MALGHFFSNRGKYVIAHYDIAGMTSLYMGLLKTATDVGAPAALDTQAEVEPLDTVTGLLALTGVTEASGGSYARVNLTSVTATEDDGNSRVNLDSANVTFTAVPATQFIWGGFISRGTGVNGDDLVSVFILKDSGSGTSVAANGSDITATITDFARLS
jgi:hypothetical protein